MKITKIPQSKFEINYKNIVKWSNYKDRIFNECKRKFLYKYVGVFLSPKTKEKVDFLKKLKTIKNWQGEVIHKYIDMSINIGSIEKALQNFENEFDSIMSNPADKIAEFYYGYQITNSQIKEIFDISIFALKNFWFFFINNIKKENIIFMDSKGIQEFFLDEITILYKPDLVCKNENKIEVFDWKTYDVELEINQFKLYYFVFCSQGFETQCRVVSLYPSIKEERLSFDQNSIDEYKDFIRKSYDNIKKFMDDCRIFVHQDHENLFEEILEKFKQTDNKNICVKCEFRELCFGK